VQVELRSLSHIPDAELEGVDPVDSRQIHALVIADDERRPVGVTPAITALVLHPGESARATVAGEELILEPDITPDGRTVSVEGPWGLLVLPDGGTALLGDMRALLTVRIVRLRDE
jgi:hypothetical protein